MILVKIRVVSSINTKPDLGMHNVAGVEGKATIEAALAHAPEELRPMLRRQCRPIVEGSLYARAEAETADGDAAAWLMVEPCEVVS